jgi:lipid-binding SYLF domain-containing protein
MKAAKLCLAILFAPATAGLLSLTGCGSEPSTPVEQKQLVNDSQATLRDMEVADPTLKDKVDNAAGYAVFPNIAKGGVGIEVASGNGDVYQQGGKWIGSSHMGMVGAGIDLGAQTYAELILFDSPQSLSNFENAGYKLDAGVSAVAIQASAARDAKFQNGVLVLVQGHGGIMVEANLGAQQFTLKAANPQPAPQP